MTEVVALPAVTEVLRRSGHIRTWLRSSALDSGTFATKSSLAPLSNRISWFDNLSLVHRPVAEPS